MRSEDAQRSPADKGPSSPSGSDASTPTIQLPKGGGAIRGVGEKFAANPVTGTGSMSVPIATSPGRSGFDPQLSLSYDSGAGNGPFGFGWSLSLPSIARKTDKGLPQYHDAIDSDVFVLSGAEDLVPVLVQNAQGKWERENLPERTVNGVTYRVDRYRPRIEGLFARIERWTNTGDATDVFWRSISKNNITTWYGKTAESRIADPANPSHIFSWLICQNHDDKGNVVVYGYKPENSARIFEDGVGNSLAKAHERNRTGTSRSAQRYLKRIRYGNRSPYFPALKDDAPWPELPDAQAHNGSNAWHFEAVFDYGEHGANAPTPNDAGTWPARYDPFSSYRAGFEVRTYRICQRVLMFHHFPGEAGVERDCLVRSTDFTYTDEVDPTDARNPVYTFLKAVTQTGYRRSNGGYDQRSLPPVEFAYTEPIVQEAVEEVDRASLQNLPIGLDSSAYRWTDLHGEGIPGILTEQADAWYYKRNWSPIPSKLPDGSQVAKAKLAPIETVALKPNVALSSGAEFMDLAGDGQPDVVVMEGPAPGLYEHDAAEGWQSFRPFTSRLNRDLRDPNLKFVDLDGDGHADVLITEDEAWLWHASLAEEGFGPARRVARALDEEKGPRIVFADGTQSIYLADLSGDGLTDIVRIRNGEVCYWPNLGYGRFGAKVTMDQAPHFDNPDQFDHTRIRMADIDGSGATDIIYLHRDGVRLYFNQSGNSWSAPHILRVFPRVDDLVSIVPVDLLGNGTACLVWSSSLPSDARRPMRYVNLMGGQKPHLLVKTVNNLGAETRVHYAPSTKFYLQDKRDGKPWITRLPFPVHVVERAVTYDHISRNRFVTRYAYHHGYFDGAEREFRGFGLVESWDTAEVGTVEAADTSAEGANLDAASFVPPVLTKTWFHTGVYLGRGHVSDFFAGLLDPNDTGEYYREPGLIDAQARSLLLNDTVLPTGLTVEEAREACRGLKGSMLRQEVYALDDSGTKVYPHGHPYTVTEQNFTVRRLQPRGDNRHGVFFTHARESISYHYERVPADPRIGHALTLEVDNFGNVLKSAAIGYGRRKRIRVIDEQGNVTEPLNPGLTELDPHDQAKQTQILLTYTESRVTRDHDTGDEAIDAADDYRTPLPCESRTYELSGLTLPVGRSRFTFDEVLNTGETASQLDYEQSPTDGQIEKRLIEHLRTYYQRNDLAGPLPLGELQSLALPFESYKLAFTPGLVAEVYGGRASDAMLENEGRYVHTEGDANWWIPSGESFYSPDPTDAAPQELAYARQHFFLPHRYRDPFHSNAVNTESFVIYDAYDLLVHETRDALGNQMTVGERRWVLPDGTVLPEIRRNDYRVLQPALVMDPNRNRTEVAFDALGMVVGTAVMGKPEENPIPGDRLAATFRADLTQLEIEQFLANPKGPLAATLLDDATTRIVYDLTAYWREPDPAKKPPAAAATLARETHASDPVPVGGLRIQVDLGYSDGFGREIQKKIQAESGPAPTRDATGKIIVGPDGQPQMTPNDVSPRWVGSGWTVFNNKGKPVRQYEPFFTDTHRFEVDARIGVSPVLYYDPVGRVVATLHPNHSYEKVVFDPWQQTTWDVNDTTSAAINPGDSPFDPKNDPDVGHYFERLADAAYLPTWYDLRTNAAQALLAWPDTDALGQAIPDNIKRRAFEKRAAEKAAAHANTPTTAHFDTLGRPFLTVAHNKVVCPNHDLDGTQGKLHTRVELDIEGNQRAVRDAIVQNGDALGRIVMRYDYDMLGNRVHQLSMEAGARWMLNDVAGQPIRAWDSRGHEFSTTYDALRRPVGQFVHGTTNESDPRTQAATVMIGKIEYGESLANAIDLNLRTRPFKIHDQAGCVTNALHDFKGNPLRVSRTVTDDHKKLYDWANDSVLVGWESFTSETEYDALDRPTELRTPLSNKPNSARSSIRPTYNEANLLNAVEANLRGDVAANGQPTWTPFVTNIDYDAKGQRKRIDYGNGNGVSTFYGYDPLTFRLIHLLTRRNTADFPKDCPQPPPAGWPGCQVQNLHYAYDPVGNITHIRDDAQQKIYFHNKRVEPSAEYTYDAIYQLIEATGREHLGQIGGAPIPHSHNDAGRVGLLSADAAGRFNPNDGKAMGTYIERYVYDAVGNFLEMQHRGSGPVHASWTRGYAYNEPSLLEPFKTSNRLSSTTIGTQNGQPVVESYTHDAHGNMTKMQHLSLMRWDYQDQLHASSKQVVNNGGTPETTWYVYDADGQRVRKVTERQTAAGQTPTRVKERIYVGGFEIYREYGNDGDTVTLERETLHIMDNSRRLALVETRADTPTPEQLIRYQFGNHLGSASLELDDQAQIISYEEYTPYGSTTYQAVRRQTETPKRYRYTGMERDEESGLNYHGARYYAPWLGRWTSCDPKGVSDSPNLYLYAVNSPVIFTDPFGASILDDIGSVLGSAWESTKAAASSAWESTKAAASSAWESTKAAASSAWESTKAAASSAWESTKAAASSAWEWTKGAASSAWEWTKNALESTFNWVVAPLVRVATNALAGAALGSPAGPIGTILGGIIGGITGAFHGWGMAAAGSYDWSKGSSWAMWLVDNTWSLPNSFVGSLWATLNIAISNPIDYVSSSGSNALIFKNGVIPGYDTTLGNVIAGNNVLKHEQIHVRQARLFGPLYVPSVVANYAIWTIFPIWLFWEKSKIGSFGDYFMKGVYPNVWNEAWANEHAP